MKKIYLILAVASAVLAANSCDKENISSTSREPMIVKFTAKAADTKTVFGEAGETSIPVLWEGGENLDVCVNEHASAAVQNEVYVQVPEEGTPSSTATWNYDFSKYYGVGSVTYVPTAPYTFYAFYPGDHMRAFHNTTSGKAHGIKIESLPSEQNPEVNSCDPKAMFLCSVSDTYQTWPENVTMSDFVHMTAYGCITLGTGIPDTDKVRKVTVTANEGQYLAGTGWYYYAGENKGTWDHYDGPTGLAPTETLILNTSAKENIWFGCRPTTALTSLTFGVYTDKGYYEVTKELENKNFVAGVVAKMTVNGFTKQTKIINYVWATTNCEVATNSSKTIPYYTPENSDGVLVWDGDVTTQTFMEGDPALPWTLSATVIEGKKGIKGYYIGNDVTYYRLKIGTQDYGYVNPFILTSSLAGYKVKGITVWASSAGTNLHTLTAKVGDTVFIDTTTLGKSEKAVGNTGYEYSGEVETAVSGEVEIKISAPGTVNTMYLYKILMDLEYAPETE